MDNLNRKSYEAKVIVNYYVDLEGELQVAERTIFTKYKAQLQGAKILDIGCGAGRMSEILHGQATEYLGIDYSEEMIKSCEEHFPHIAFKQNDARDMTSMTDGYFDVVVFSFNGIDYMTHDARLHTLSEINRVLKDKGLFIFSSHNLNAFKIQEPELQFDLHPYRQLHHFIDYIRSMRNRVKLAKREQVYEHYAILNDPGHQFALMTYYIKQKLQVRQLEESNFHFSGMYDTEGKAINIDETDSSSTWIYYVANK